MQRKFGPKVWCDIQVTGKMEDVKEEEEEDLLSKMQKEINDFGIPEQQQQPPFDPNRFSVQQHSSLDDNNNNNNNSFYQDCIDKQPPILPQPQIVDNKPQKFQPMQQPFAQQPMPSH